MELTKGVNYKIKTNDGSKFTAVYMYDFEEGIARFEGRGGVRFWRHEDIVSADEYEQTKTKAVKTKSKQCDRCGGAGKLNAFKHVEGGNCYKCGGRGKI